MPLTDEGKKKNSLAQSLAVLGTGSDVGKSVLVTGICRLLVRTGIRVAPFKAQNMSLNSFVTLEGGEMGRAQALQAQACRLSPHVAMNPILLKPEMDSRSQVIVHGNVWGSRAASDYFTQTPDLFEYVKASYQRLASQYEAIVIEGAGSAAELNLRDRDIVNWPVVKMANASVILVADIDRGGVFAQVLGTLDLLASEERQRIIGIVINKFRGDARLFEDGVRMIEQRACIPVLGVLPYLRHLELDQEDSLNWNGCRKSPFSSHTVNVAVTLLPHMSNFTDFNPLEAESDVALRYISTPQELQGTDVLILPGTKTTMADLEYLKKKGFQRAVAQHVDNGGEVVGICGGFQMLSREISDPEGIETGGSSKGFGLLEATTEIRTHKTTRQVKAFPLHIAKDHGCMVDGYEIHTGITTRQSAEPCFQIISSRSHARAPSSSCSMEKDELALDGAINHNTLVWGTYIHGVFDQPGFRRSWLNRVRRRKGLEPLDAKVSEAVSTRLSNALDRWADHVHTHLNVDLIFSTLGNRDFF